MGKKSYKRKKVVNIKIDPNVHNKLKEQSAKYGFTFSETIDHLLDQIKNDQKAQWRMFRYLCDECGEECLKITGSFNIDIDLVDSIFCDNPDCLGRLK